MTPLASSNLDGMEYDPSTQVLKIRFKSGRSYSYAGVPQTIADGLENADSPGQFFNGQIKNSFEAS